MISLGLTAREAAISFLVGSENGSSRAVSFDKIDDPRDRALALELAGGVMRWRNLLDYVASAYSSRPLSSLSPRVRNALRIGIYQLTFMGMPPYVAVGETVDCLPNPRERGYVNACLRSVSRTPGSIELPPLHVDELRYLELRYSYPRWMVELFREKYGLTGAVRLMKTLNKRPRLYLRVNTYRFSPHEVLSRLVDAGYVATPGRLFESIAMERTHGIQEIPGFKEGAFAVQDEAAMLVGRVVDPQPGQLVWDMCAAPGGKTAHIATLMDGTGKVLATDVEPERLKLVEETVGRLRLPNIEVRLSDAAEGPGNGAREGFDRVLLDAPCSGLGTISRNPDIKWQRREKDIPKMAARQEELLRQAWRALKLGGFLVYSTCTLTYEENEGVWGRFLESHPKAVPVDPGRWIPEKFRASACSVPGSCYLLPHESGTDGFFIAKAAKVG